MNNGAVSHTVVADDGSFNSGQLGGSATDPYGGGSTPGGVYTRVFAAQGSFPYHCVNHAGMTGTVTVTP
jgi:plastocyanin